MISRQVVYDLHTLYSRKLAGKAVENIGGYYGIAMAGRVRRRTGRKPKAPQPEVCYLLRCVKGRIHGGHQRFLLEAAAEKPYFIPFSSFYPFLPVAEAEKELIRVKAKGTRG